MINEKLWTVKVPENSELESNLNGWYPENAFAKEHIDEAADCIEEGLYFRSLELDKQIREFVENERKAMPDIDKNLKPNIIVVFKKGERAFYTILSYYSEQENEEIIKRIKAETEL